LPGATDRYFDVRDNEDELGKLTSAKSAVLHPIPSLHGHRAGNPLNNPRDQAFLKAEVAALLSK
jgi:homoserine O-acetyltransferase